MSNRSAYATRVSLVVALGGFLMGFDAAVISGVVGPVEQEFGLDADQIGWVVACLTLGSTIAMAFAGPLADRLGRRPMLAATAGVLIVPIQQAHYLMGLDPLLLSFIVVIIGGLGSLRGTIVAAFLIGLGDGVVSMFFSPTLAKILATVLVAMVLVVRPHGLFGERP